MKTRVKKYKTRNSSAVKFIELYQKNKNPLNKRCRFIPTCSNYSKDCYKRFNFFKASILTLIRLLKCNRLTKMGTYDRVPRYIIKEDLIDCINENEEH